MTPKTVENHLGRSYTKLGINGRRELAVRRPDTAQTGNFTPVRFSETDHRRCCVVTS